MSLRRAVAAPFRQRGVDRMSESEFVVALSLDRDWFSPDQAQRLVDVAASQGLLDREDEAVVVAFDPAVGHLDAGTEKQEAVAAINRLQADLGVTIEAAAVLYARRQGLDVAGLAQRAREEL